MMKYSKGFSLIELMMVVAIMGILTTVAIGWYGNNVIAANRSEGRSTLTATAGSLEKCKSLFGAYDAANCTVGNTVMSESNLYSIDTTTRTPTTFTLTATPLGRQVADNDCSSMTLTNTGIKGGAPAVNECW